MRSSKFIVGLLCIVLSWGCEKDETISPSAESPGESNINSNYHLGYFRGELICFGYGDNTTQSTAYPTNLCISAGATENDILINGFDFPFPEYLELALDSEGVGSWVSEDGLANFDSKLTYDYLDYHISVGDEQSGISCHGIAIRKNEETCPE